MTHINCAVNKGLIVPLEYMMEFYDITKQSLESCIPFYCPAHSLELIKDYKVYLRQMNECLTLTKKETNNDEHLLKNTLKEEGSSKDSRTEATNEDWSEPHNNIGLCPNIANLEHQGFAFMNCYPSVMDNFVDPSPMKCTDFQKKEICDDFSLSLQKPNYLKKEDSLNFNNLNFYTINDENFPEFNLDKSEINNAFNFNLLDEGKAQVTSDKENFEEISHKFYNHFREDIMLMKKEKRSKVTISELKELKGLFISVITAYKDFDPDLMKYYIQLCNDN